MVDVVAVALTASGQELHRQEQLGRCHPHGDVAVDEQDLPIILSVVVRLVHEDLVVEPFVRPASLTRDGGCHRLDIISRGQERVHITRRGAIIDVFDGQGRASNDVNTGFDASGSKPRREIPQRIDNVLRLK